MSFHNVFFDDQAGQFTGAAQAAQLPCDHALLGAAVAGFVIAPHQFADDVVEFDLGHN